MRRVGRRRGARGLLVPPTSPSKGSPENKSIGLVVVCGSWADRVVPFAVEGVGFQLWPDGGHLGGADLDFAGVAVGVGFGMHGQSRPGGSGADEVDDDLMAGQGSSPPVHRDVGEQAVLYPVPFAGAGREVEDRDGQAGGCQMVCVRGCGSTT